MNDIMLTHGKGYVCVKSKELRRRNKEDKNRDRGRYMERVWERESY